MQRVTRGTPGLPPQPCSTQSSLPRRRAATCFLSSGRTPLRQQDSAVRTSPHPGSRAAASRSHQFLSTWHVATWSETSGSFVWERAWFFIFYALFLFLHVFKILTNPYTPQGLKLRTSSSRAARSTDWARRAPLVCIPYISMSHSTGEQATMFMLQEFSEKQPFETLKKKM